MEKPIEKYTAPLTGKYAQLRDDLKTALAVGQAVEDAATKNSSFYNWDCVSIVLPRWDSEGVKQAAKEAGTFCSRGVFKYKWIFRPITRSRGASNTLNVKAMAASLRGMGYNASVYGLK